MAGRRTGKIHRPAGRKGRRTARKKAMCRNIKTLFNLEPTATDEEIREASLQFVRKLSGFNTPSKANEAAFRRAVDEVVASSRKLLDSLLTSAEPRDRAVAAERARARAAVRFGSRRLQNSSVHR